MCSLASVASIFGRPVASVYLASLHKRNFCGGARQSSARHVMVSPYRLLAPPSRAPILRSSR
jgi:hypothetical protein